MNHTEVPILTRGLGLVASVASECNEWSGIRVTMLETLCLHTHTLDEIRVQYAYRRKKWAICRDPSNQPMVKIDQGLQNTRFKVDLAFQEGGMTI